MESTGGGSVNSGGHGFFLGFDFSTQQVFCFACFFSYFVINHDGPVIIHLYVINYGNDMFYS